MLHGNLTPAPARHSRLASVAIALTVAVLISLVATPANALSRTADTNSDGNIVRLVRLADGTLRVERGLAFHTASTGTVVAEEADVRLHTTVVDVTADLDADGLIDDARRSEQWGLDLFQAETVWQRADGAGQVIAIVDSGVDGDHPDFEGQLVDGFSATGGDELVDGHGHGTHVAGTAAAAIGGYGVAGLAHAAQIMPIQVTDAQGLAYASDVAEGLIWAASNGATVANLSLAGTQESHVLNGAIDYAIARGVVVVVAAGNEYKRSNPRTYPASHRNVIAVGALRDARTRSAFSSTGDWVDVMAPGSTILSTRPDAAFGYASGTSMASPAVAGAVALLRSTTDLTPAEVHDLLTSTAIDLGDAGRDDEMGHGLVDLGAALDELGIEAPENDKAIGADVDADDLADGTFDAAPGAGTAAGGVSGAPKNHTTLDLDDNSWLDQGWGV